MKIVIFNHNRIILSFILPIFILAACSLNQTPGHSADTILTPTQFISPSPNLPIYTRIPYITQEWLPSKTAISGRTPTPDTYPETTPMPSLSAADQATQDYKQTLSATMYAKVETEMAFLPGCDSPIARDYSPDGNWVAVFCVNPVTYVYKANHDAQPWALRYNELLGIADDTKNQFYSIWPKHWSPDGRYLYFSINPHGDGGCSFYLDGTYLMRLDLVSGKVSETLRGNDYRFYSFSFSPDDSYLAYLRTWIEHPILNIEDLKTGVEQHISLGDQYDEAGDVIWSPDKSQLIISARTQNNCQDMKFYIINITLSDQSQKVLWEGSNPGYIPVEWTDTNHVTLRDYFSHDQAILDLDTLQTTPLPTSTVNP